MRPQHVQHAQHVQHIYGILGHPVGQSLSPLLHNWGFGLFGYPGVYMSFDKTPDELAGFMAAVRSLPLAGLSVTIPHKEAIMPYLDVLTERARAVGAVNTVYWQNGKLVGENTDVAGFLGPLLGPDSPAGGPSSLKALPRRPSGCGPLTASGFSSALVLGAGGAARAVLAGLMELNLPRVFVAARRLEQARNLIESLAQAFHSNAFRAEAAPWEDRLGYIQPGCLVINTTPLGMVGKALGQSPVPADAWPKIAAGSGLAYDLVYNPARPRFLQDAAAAGWDIQEGLDFFAIQGREQFRLWTGHELPLDETRRLLRTELERRA